MKKFKVLLVALVLLFAGTTIFAQEGIASGFLKPVTKESLVADNGDKELISATWKLRLDAALVGTASYVSDFAHPRAFSKMGVGPVFTRFDTDASRTWGVGAMLTIPTSDLGSYGVAVVGSYSIFKIGLNYDFKESTLPDGTTVKGLAVLTSLTIDLFNVIQ